MKQCYEYNIHFNNLSFLDLVDNLEGLHENNLHDMELKLLFEDFREYCYQSNLISDEQYKFLFAPTGFSYKWNIQHKIYYCPTDWHSQSFRFFGLYNNKSVRTISEIETVIKADFNADTQDLVIYSNNHSTEQIERLKTGLIELNESHKGLKYYLFPENNFYETNFKKTSHGGIQGYRYKNLKEFLPNNKFDDIKDVAEKLEKVTWK